MGRLGVFVILLFLSPFLTGFLQAQTEELIFVHLISGNGDTTPLESYPTNPYKDLSIWHGLENGELTKGGKRHQFELGSWLRQRYSGFIQNTFDPEEVFSRSIDLNRCLESANSILSGLFPSDNLTKFSVFSSALNLDYLLNGGKCYRYSFLYRNFLQTEEQRELLTKYKSTLEYLTEKTGKQVKSLRDVQSIYNCLKIEEMNNLTLPSWTDKVYPNPMEEISALALQSLTGTREMAKYKSGILLKEILDRFKNKLDVTLNLNLRFVKIWMYSVQDTQIANFLNILKMFDPPFNPPFNALILMELKVKEFEEIPYISIFYKNGTSDVNGQQMVIPECGFECPLSKMIELYVDVMLQHPWDEECNFKHDCEIPDIFIYAVTFIFIFVILFAFYISFKKKPQGKIYTKL